MRPALRLPVLAGLAAVLLGVVLAGPPLRAVESPSAPAIRGITLDAVRPPVEGTLPQLRAMGVTHLTLVAFGFQPGKSTPEIRMNPDARWYSESDAGMRALAGEARTLGMGIIVKPHLWLRGGAWRAEIGFETEADWEAWEAQYHTFLLHYARLAQELDAALLVIGTELAMAVRARPAFWRSLIADVRAVYGGPLTYAANWYEEYEHITFWDALDYIGVQAYFPLAGANDPPPTLDALTAAWAPHHKALNALHRQTGKPILFTEIGYRSVSYAAAEPWRWPSRDEAIAPDYDLQARLYEALFTRFWTEPWYAGLIIWKWHPDSDQRRRRPRDLDFTPQSKPAEQVIARWFTR